MGRHILLALGASLALINPVQAQDRLKPERLAPPITVATPAPVSLDLSLESAHPDQPELRLNIQAQGLETIEVLLNDEMVKSLSAAETAQPLSLPVPTQQEIRIQLQGEAAGQRVKSAPLLVDTAQYAPQPLRIALKNHQVLSETAPLVVTSTTTQNGYLSLEIDGQSVYGSRFQGVADILPPVPIAPGAHQIQLVLTNAWGRAATPIQSVYNLGIAPPAETYIVIDKYNFTLYWIQKNRLSAIYPIAIGRPKTPTVPGYWLLGKKEVMPNPDTGWGVRRLKIYRENEYQTHWSGYAIHGTNRPKSIGTEASHGCVRMFNEDVTRLYEEVALKTPVIIKDKLEVYIDEMGAAPSKEENQQ